MALQTFIGNATIEINLETSKVFHFKIILIKGTSMASGTLFIISAPSGAGKTTLVNGLLASWQSEHSLERVITYTSRPPRHGEVHGIDYHFITPQEFETRINEGFFIEWSTAYGTYYGTSSSLMRDLAQGKNLIVIPDRMGAQAIFSKFDPTIYNVITIWVEIPSLEVLESRLKSRGQNTTEQILARLKLAAQEIEEEVQFPFYKHKILNNFFDISLENLKKVIENEIFLKKKKQNKSAAEYAEKPL